MAEKLLQSRIVLKYDSLDAWESSTVILKPGEVAFAAVPNKTGRTSVVFKVGDGAKTWRELEYASALAADVNTYAKLTDENFKTAVKDLAAEKVKDTDTQYKIVKVDNYNFKLQSKPLGSTTWTDVTGSTIVIPNDTAAIQALQNLVGNTAVATQITNAINALNLATTYEAKGAAAAAQTAAQTYADNAVKTLADGAVATNTENISALQEAVGEGGSVSAQITTAIGNLKTTDTAVDGKYVSAVSQANGKITVTRESLPDYTEVYDAKGAAAAVDTKLTTEVTRAKGAEKAAKDAADAAQTTANQAKSAIDTFLANADASENAIDTLKEIQTQLNEGEASAASLLAATNANKDAIAKLNGNASTAGSVAKTVADAIAAQNLSQYATDTELSALDGRVGTAEGKVSTLEGKVKTLEDVGSQANVIETVKVNGTALTPDADKAVNVTVPTGALASKSKVAESDLASALATKINNKANKSDLAAIAKSGNVNDLAQTSGDVLVFNCGSATVNV